MTDIWCFTCGHELARKRWPQEGYEHASPDDVENGCACREAEIPCEPR